MKKKILVEGTSCGHCVKHVKKALKKIGAKGFSIIRNIVHDLLLYIMLFKIFY